MLGDFVAKSFSPYTITPPYGPVRNFDITSNGTKLMNAVMDYCLGDKKAVVKYERIAPDALADIEFAVLERNPKDKTVFILNWEEEKSSIIEFGLKMPRGKYEIEEWSIVPEDKLRIDDMKIEPFKLKGKKIFTDRDISNLKIELEPQQIRILHIKG